MTDTTKHITAAERSAWNAKQDAIPENTYDDYGAATSAVSNHNSASDAHAALFAEKANTEDLANVATSGDYEDLTNNPSINGITLKNEMLSRHLGLASSGNFPHRETLAQETVEVEDAFPVE